VELRRALEKALNRENLEALGAQRLAELLIELGTGNAAVKRRLRLELASTQSPGEVAKEIRKRLTTAAEQLLASSTQPAVILARSL
jgi:hypothetical protein